MKPKDQQTNHSDKTEGGSRFSLKWFLLLHLCLLLNSMTGIFSKLAGRQATFSFRFFLYYGGTLLILVVFALLWQQVLKRMSLSFAFLNKPITVLYSLLWSVVLFREHVTLRMLIGSLVILAGIMIGVSDQ